MTPYSRSAAPVARPETSETTMLAALKKREAIAGGRTSEPGVWSGPAIQGRFSPANTVVWHENTVLASSSDFEQSANTLLAQKQH